MLHWPSIAELNWQTLVRLAAPLRVSSALTGDLAESFHRISKQRGEQVAKRWLSAQVVGNAKECLVEGVREAPGILMLAVILGLVFYFMISAEAERLLRGSSALLTIVLPVMLSWTLAFFLRGKEMPFAILSALAWLTLLFGIEGYQLRNGSAVASLSEILSILVGAVGWMAGAGIRKAQQVRDHRVKESGLQVQYQHVTHFEYQSLIDATVETVFAFHERPDAIKLLTPWWLFPSFKRLRGNGLEEGVEVMVTTAGISHWHARHVAYERNRLFVDEMVSGPMKSWRHEHHFISMQGQTVLTDSIDFVPIGPAWLVLKGLRMLFRFRHAVTKRCCEA